MILMITMLFVNKIVFSYHLSGDFKVCNLKFFKTALQCSKKMPVHLFMTQNWSQVIFWQISPLFKSKYIFNDLLCLTSLALKTNIKNLFRTFKFFLSHTANRVHLTSFNLVVSSLSHFLQRIVCQMSL